MSIYVLAYTEASYQNGGTNNNLLISEDKDKIIAELYRIHKSNCCECYYDAFGGESAITTECSKCKFIEKDEEKNEYQRTYCETCLNDEKNINESIGAYEECVGCQKCTYELDDCYMRKVCDDCRLWSGCNACGFSTSGFVYMILSEEYDIHFNSHTKIISCENKVVIKLNVLDKTKSIELNDGYGY